MAPKCINCSGPHSAAYQGCPKYKEQKLILKVKGDKNISYAEAAKKIKAQPSLNATKTQPMQNPRNPLRIPAIDAASNDPIRPESTESNR